MFSRAFFIKIAHNVNEGNDIHPLSLIPSSFHLLSLISYHFINSSLHQLIPFSISHFIPYYKQATPNGVHWFGIYYFLPTGRTYGAFMRFQINDLRFLISDFVECINSSFHQFLNLSLIPYPLSLIPYLLSLTPHLLSLIPHLLSLYQFINSSSHQFLTPQLIK